MNASMKSSPSAPDETKIVRIFLCGDVMIGRGIDQILPAPCPPELHEEYVSSALGYVSLAERVCGPIPRPAPASYIWGAALDAFYQKNPDLRIINLETSLTRSEAFEPKGINYRASPENAETLRAAGIDCCVLANNHILDWGEAGLIDTLDILGKLRIRTTGAGRNRDEARRPAAIDVAGKARVVITSFALPSSGAPRHWAASCERPGVNLLPDLSEHSVELVCEILRDVRRSDDIVIVSLHWGPNWGYDIPQDHQRFAHALIDRGEASIIHGHSSHHAKALEIYKNRLILYGCGDFINDYEGIAGYEQYRGDLSLMYFVDIDMSSGSLASLELTPLQIRRFRLERALPADAEWLAHKLNRESARYGVSLSKQSDESLIASWAQAAT
ncbi:CapA family protein [Methylocystis sp. WRRC1]|uniref:CapA family protein n=1 Tax=Methylocystis sp. WRRC1 TaxID=1732014 RepID=UPI001D14E4AE|nr:CapA family protein [Methylocystis sp. WRRC1]